MAGPRITGPQIPGPRTTGPRQEYLDAFDGPGWPGSSTDTGGSPQAGGRTRASLAAAAASGSGGRGAGVRPGAPGDEDGRGTDGEDGRDAGGAGRPARRGGRGRTFTGVAAAAVTTVLALIVAGQVAHGRDDRATAHKKPTDAAAPARTGPSPKPSPKPLTYEQKMAAFYPLGVHLKASGKFSTVPGHDKAPGKGRLYRYRVDVEQGLGLDGTLFAEAVQKTLNDPRSWAHDGLRTFERVSSGRPDFVITLASPGTTASWCAKSGLDTYEENVSCDSAATDRVMINAYRWAQGAKTYGKAIYAYRQMLINHEVGHRLGYNHVVCTKQGALAPVMQQQTKFLTYNGITCKANPWPYPDK
jgi:hypothetical protein